MYSKDRGITHRESTLSFGNRPPPGDRQPAYRQSRPERVQVPPNYSGHAIVDGEERPLGSMIPVEPDPAHTADPLPIPDTPIPRFDGLPRVSDLGDTRRHAPRTLPASFEVREEPSEDRLSEGRLSEGRLSENRPSENRSSEGHPFEDYPPEERVGTNREPPIPLAPPPSPPPADRPSRGLSLPDPSRFLAGHGFGLEEILILGLILFLLRENGDCDDRGDLDETVVLLGLLLLLGWG